jgi:septum formation protein
MIGRLGVPFEVVAPDVDESRRPGESIREFVRRVPEDKARAGLRKKRADEGTQPSPHLALAADTIVVVGGEILGKPRDHEDAARMLRLLAGAEHEVLTGVTVAGETARTITVSTTVRFRPMTEAQIRWLADSGDGDDKAGAYGLQGLAGMFVERVDGSVSNVVGLPMAETVELLASSGLRLPW